MTKLNSSKLTSSACNVFQFCIWLGGIFITRTNTRFHIHIFNSSLIIDVSLNTKWMFSLSRHLVVYILRDPMLVLVVIMLYTFCSYFIIWIKFTENFNWLCQVYGRVALTNNTNGKQNVKIKSDLPDEAPVTVFNKLSSKLRTKQGRSLKLIKSTVSCYYTVCKVCNWNWIGR